MKTNALLISEQLEQLSLGYGLKPEYTIALKTASVIMRTIHQNVKCDLSADDLRNSILLNLIADERAR